MATINRDNLIEGRQYADKVTQLEIKYSLSNIGGK